MGVRERVMDALGVREGVLVAEAGVREGVGVRVLVAEAGVREGVGEVEAGVREDVGEAD